jgi:transposase
MLSRARVVVAKYGREGIAWVRFHRANELRVDRRGRRVISGERWLLLKNRDTLTAGQDVELDGLLAAKHGLFVAYVLRDALKELSQYRQRELAARA